MAGFALPIFYAGIAGSLMVIYEPYVATKYLYWSTSGEVVIMSVIGGVGTLIGPIVGAAFMLYFENVVQGFIGEQWKLALGLIFVLIVIFLPGGFADLSRRLWRLAGHRIRGRRHNVPDMRSEEHTSALQSLMRISYAVFCLEKKNSRQSKLNNTQHHTPVKTHIKPNDTHHT